MRQLWRVATLLLLQWLEVTATTTSAASGQSSPSIFPTFMTHAGQTKHTSHIHLTDTLDEAGSSLSAALLTLISRELASCSLVVAADANYITSPVLHALACLPNQKQVVSVAGGWEKAGKRVMWQAPGCRAYIFLLHQAGVLLSHSNAAPSSWDYAGRYVFVGLTREDLVALTLTHKGRKTEHLVGIVQSERAGEWQVYLNQLYWGLGIRLHATWRKGRFTSLASPFIDKISDIQGSVLKVVTFEWQPSTLYHRTEAGQVDFLYGRDVEVVRALAPVFNFTIKFIEPPNDERWGDRLPNGSWDGIVGMLGRGDAELAIANLFVSALQGRDQYQGYTTFFDTDVLFLTETVPVLEQDSCFIIRMEPPLPRWQSPGLPYSFSTWMVILSSLFVISIILNLIASTATNEWVTRDEGKKTTDLGSFSSALFFTVSLHLQESFPALPHHNATRVMVASMLLYTIILAKAYSCNLTAFLTVSRQPTGVETIQDVYESQLALYETTYFIRNSLAESPNIFLRGLVERHRLVKDMEQIMKEISKGKGIYVQNRSAREFNINTQLRPAEGSKATRMLKECFATYTIAAGIPSYSPLKRRFDEAISRIFESGLVRYWKQESYVKFRKNNKHDDRMDEKTRDEADGVKTTMVPLSLDHLQTAFYVLFSNLIFSSVVFLIENIQ